MNYSHAGPSILSTPSKSNNGTKFQYDSGDEEPQVRMRVGEMYQATVPVWDEDAPKVDGLDGMRIWSPCHDIPDEKLEEYCRIAKEKHSYNMEQALGMLLWHKYSIEDSLNDMANFTPMPDEWTVEDKVLFEQAYTFHGKSFRKIQQLLPDKDISQLVKYYYLWKKSRAKTSLIDRQAKRFMDIKNQGSEETKDAIMNGNSQEEYTNNKDEDRKPMENNTQKNRLPKGIHLSQGNIDQLLRYPGGAHACVNNYQSKIITSKTELQAVKQNIGALEEKINDENIANVESLVNASLHMQGNAQSHTAEWTKDEMVRVVDGVRRFGRNFDSIAAMVGTKSADQIKSFCTTQHSNLGLNQILREYESNQHDSAISTC